MYPDERAKIANSMTTTLEQMCHRHDLIEVIGVGFRLPDSHATSA